MASNIPSLPPELASILATLSQHAAPAPVSNNEVTSDAFATEEETYDPADFTPLSPAVSRARPQTRTAQPQQPLIDPATITDWSAGLRCVSKVASQNSRFAEVIKRMMQDQRKHEMQWYSSRQALKQEQARRGANTGQLQSILKSVGGSGADDSHTPQSQEDKLAELSTFDQKIYVAQVRMNQAMNAELKGLGVPFFGTPSDCVGYGQSDRETNNDTFEVRSKWSPRVTPEELQDLQRRMIKYLEDMYKD